MAGITIEQAQSSLDALMSAQLAFTGQSKVVIQTANGSRTVEFTSLDELTKAINYWNRTLTGLMRKSSGRSRHGVSLADFRNTN